ncbi:MAG: enoyl-CoA hydratase/isomerase family protein [Alphaproteobacteria bacterium]|nr:enoyl-CoA hydratase/isomerase family protein [Alphaproteobacteria bacterium]
MTDGETVILTRRGPIGHILLNRPKALNAITFEMVIAVADALSDWEKDDAVRAVIIEGAGDRAFCAGGDVIAVSKAGQEQTDLCRDFFQAEYRLNRTIHLFEKPYIAFLDGITMGGGVGLSVHGKHRIVTEKTLFAMPETAIGLFPDVGGSHFLSRCPGETGTYLGLTGARLGAADMMAVGLADSHMPSDSRDAFFAALEAADWSGRDADSVVSEITGQFATPAGETTIETIRADLDRLFAGDDLEEIVARLSADTGEFAAKAAALLDGKSPTMLKVSLKQLRLGAMQDFDANMVMEYRIVRRALQPGADFHEGVRALLIDKDKAPKWNPARLEDVSDAMVHSHFEAPPEGDLVLDPE